MGRTGSGKVVILYSDQDRLTNHFTQSSLTLSLLRCIYTSGKVYYDSLATDKINLEALRQNITIIPQVVSSDYKHSLRYNISYFFLA